MEVDLQLRDGASQLAFWKLNLKYLQSKEEALVDFFKALCSAYNEFETAVLEERTRVGSGYSGTFQFSSSIAFSLAKLVASFSSEIGFDCLFILFLFSDYTFSG